MRTFKTATGWLFVDDYEKGKLETLSIGDYGKEKNIKAKFLGFDKEINGVENGKCKPLSEKWVVTLSTQYGCPMKCKFCDVPNIKFCGNASFNDLKKQLYNAISLHPDVKYTDRLNIHFARMGEPIFNEEVMKFASWLYYNKQAIKNETGLRVEVIHPVLSTSLPKSFNTGLIARLQEWCKIKNDVYNGQAGLQFSINSTNDEQRNNMFSDLSCSLERISEISKLLPTPTSRKYCLNFAYATGYEIDVEKLDRLFDKEKFMIKITPIHNNQNCSKNGIETIGGYKSYAPYKEVEQSLIDSGWDVLVFIPSMDEERGLITCGNLLIGGGKLKTNNEEL